MITKEKIARINALAHKQKSEGLTEAEKIEQKALRDEYIKAFRESTLASLKRIDIQNPDGSVTPLIK